MNGFGLFATLGLVVSTGANVVFYRWLVSRVPWLGRGRARLALIAFLASTLVMPLGVRVSILLGGSDRLAWLEGLGLLWVLALLVALPAIFVIEIVRRVVPESPVNPGRRDAMTALAGNAFVGVAAAPLGWGLARTRFDVEVVEVPIRIPRLAKALDGFSIVQISDVHVGAFLGDRELRHAEDLIRKLRPDLLAMTGDLVHMRESYLGLACEWLVRLRGMSRFGLVGILGNHEYYVGRSAVKKAYAAAGLDLLINEVRHVAKNDGGGFSLAGVDDYFAATSGRGPGPRLDLVTPALFPDKARILLCHQPQLHVHSAAYDLDLQLSGHTHGGQIAPFGPLVARAMFSTFAGHARIDGCHLYVNRGLGTSGPPSRVAVRPEITKIVLVSG